MNKETFYVTTPIYYVNAKPHIGSAYTTLMADARARFERMDGKDVFFLTGMDEHGQKVAESAEKNGLDPQSWCDSMVPEFSDLWKKLTITNDVFFRTTQENHLIGVQKFLERLKERGFIYKSEYDGWYCVPEETFFTETQVRHANESQVVDHSSPMVSSDEAGLAQEDSYLHNCPDCGRPLTRVKEDSWFFKLSAFQEQLLAYYEENPDFIQPEIRRNEVISFVSQGLHDLSISRTTFNWGVPLTFDPDHVVYVWVDALINYINAVGFGEEAKEETFKHFWPANVHIVGKDIIRFHCVIWPAMLMAAGLDLPRQVFVHGFLLAKGKKMSKSLGNVIAPMELVDLFGLDGYRYYFLTDIQHGADGSISYERMAQVYNADLANSWGNLCSRTFNMVVKYCDGKTPACPESYKDQISPLKEIAQDLFAPYAQAFRTTDYHGSAQSVLELVAAANLYIETQAPWALAKDPAKHDELMFVLYNLLESIRIVALLFHPFMPTTSDEVLSRMSLPSGDKTTNLQEAIRWGGLSSGLQVQKGEALFPRLDIEELGNHES